MGIAHVACHNCRLSPNLHAPGFVKSCVPHVELSLEKRKKLLLIAKNVRCRLEFAQHHQDWTIYGWYMMIFLVMRLRSINFNFLAALGAE